MSTEVPPYSVRVLKHRNAVSVKVTLGRNIPDSCVNVEVKPNKFHLDTLKFSKNFDFPENVTVEDKNLEASLEFGILNLLIPIKGPKLEVTKPEKNLKKRKANDEASVEAVNNEEPKKREKKVKKAKFLSKDAALELISNINEQEETIINEKLTAESTKRAAINSSKKEKLEKKQAKEDLKNQAKVEKKKLLKAKLEHEKNAPRPGKKISKSK